MIINFYSKLKIRLPFGSEFASRIIKQSARALKIKNNFELSISIIGDREIRALNKKYRRKDKVTDVLSFSQKEGQDIFWPKEEGDYLGDILICWPQLKRQARQYGKSLKAEFSLLLIHGFLHLLGYDDKTDKGSLEMDKLQTKILKKL